MSNEKMDREVILSIKHVDITFENSHKKKFKAVKDANFDIYKGETFALVGESGSGKTTLGRAILRINPCSAGEILFEGKRISGKISREEDRNVVRNIQMIFQDPAASLNERATIEYCVSEGLYNFHLYRDEEERIAKVDKALEDVGL
ncbi:MAG: ATP-binding cassette domain-containing protein, partial [Firmicutes bacterium]|nr:ATP-binding cassette domain-containing protein [Bacillota bacterium]